MDTRRIALALFAAMVIAAVATFFIISRIRAAQAAHPATIKVVAASKPLSAGTPLSAESLVLIDWPANVSVQGSHPKVDEVIGRSLIYPVEKNQPIVDKDLALPGSGIGLTVKIPEGMRAVSVRSNDVVGVAGFMYPGSHVDVVLTSRAENQAPPVTQTILQNVEVLTAGQRIEPDPNGKPETVNVVTVLLKPEDGEKLVHASTQGTIQFVLRNGADQGSVATKPVALGDLIAGTSKPAEISPKVKVIAVKKKAAAPPPSFYEVETIQAGKRSVDKFNEEKPATQVQ
jgi:pilus assembly protein CpaB